MHSIGTAVKLIEDFAPLALQENYDNCGLIYGDLTEPLKGILVTLDTNEEVVKEAYWRGANLIIEHHPTLFSAVKKLDCNYPPHRAICLAIRYGIAVYSAHTSVDYTSGGLNDYVAELIGMQKVVTVGDAGGFRIGELEKPLTLSEFAQSVKTILNDPLVHFVGDPERQIRSAAVINGGGGSHEEYVLAAKAAGADVFLTADVKYNVARLSRDLNYAIISFGHYSSEISFVDLIKKQLAPLDVPVYCSHSNPNPYSK